MSASPGFERGPVTGAVRIYTAADVAQILDCSEWWVKEQARKRRIPFTWIGGSHRFTEAHLLEILGIFERRPEGVPTPMPRAPRKRAAEPEPEVVLKARPPKRSKSSQSVA